MDNRIKELENMIQNPNFKVSDILPYALVLAGKHDKKIIPWIKQEMDGYESEEDCPEYRYVSGIPQSTKLYGGGKYSDYINSDSDIQEDISNSFILRQISTLENWLNNNNSNIVMRLLYETSTQDRLNKDGLSDPWDKPSKFALGIRRNSIIDILDRTKRELLIWVLGLSTEEEYSSNTTPSKIIFPPNLMLRLPKDLKILADDFNFNLSNDRTYTCMLIMRRMLPLSIVRKFQEDDNEEAIKKNGEYLNTSDLLAKTDPLIGNKLSTSIRSRKMLLDSSQHLYGFHPAISDVERVADVLRLFLGELFPDKNNNKNQ